MIINVNKEQALYILELVTADAAKGFGKVDEKVALVQKLESTIKYHEAKERKKAKA